MPGAARAGLGVALASIVWLAGCDGDNVCIAEPQPAIVVTVRDSISGLPAAMGALVRLRSGTFLGDFASSFNGLTIETYAPVGRYVVTVTKPGYTTWQRDGVIVEQTGDCFVDRVDVEARLEPAPIRSTPRAPTPVPAPAHPGWP
ncbi:MAG: hypothetical protein SFV24_21320 [Gemmatimonadales bacterium]|nr:hypothetical protein [Gemmatimonadales bacterium]